MNKLLKGPMPTQGMLVARVLVGGYLVYLSYSLLQGKEEGSMNPILLWGAVIVFALVGLFLLFKAIYSFAVGFYKGGKLDTSASEDTEVQGEEVNDEAGSKPLPEKDYSDAIDVTESEIEELDK